MVALCTHFNHTLTWSASLERPEVQCSASSSERDEKGIWRVSEHRQKLCPTFVIFCNSSWREASTRPVVISNWGRGRKKHVPKTIFENGKGRLSTEASSPRNDSSQREINFSLIKDVRFQNQWVISKYFLKCTYLSAVCSCLPFSINTSDDVNLCERILTWLAFRMLICSS